MRYAFEVWMAWRSQDFRLCKQLALNLHSEGRGGVWWRVPVWYGVDVWCNILSFDMALPLIRFSPVKFVTSHSYALTHILPHSVELLPHLPLAKQRNCTTFISPSSLRCNEMNYERVPTTFWNVNDTNTRLSMFVCTSPSHIMCRLEFGNTF